MTAAQQRIAIAEACGWTEVHVRSNYSNLVYGQIPKVEGEAWSSSHFSVPDYLNDLNAMHEAWKTLSHDQHKVFRAMLQARVYSQTKAEWEDNVQRSVANATAAQRAEAFLRTIGKWEDAA